MNILLIGYGKMGKIIEEIAKSRGHEISGIVTIDTPLEPNDSRLKTAEVAIEFTSPLAVLGNIQKCFDARLPLVVGTTGWYDQLKDVKERCLQQNQSLLYASNFSLGVNLFFELNKRLAQLMDPFKEFEASIKEIHHTEKLDAPSGTAITLANDLISISSSKSKWVKGDSSDSNELPIISERIDKVPGTHTIKYQSEVDSIEITHTAFNRKGFAYGAVIAAEWIVGKKGFFEMREVLNIK